MLTLNDLQWEELDGHLAAAIDALQATRANLRLARLPEPLPDKRTIRRLVIGPHWLMVRCGACWEGAQKAIVEARQALRDHIVEIPKEHMPRDDGRSVGEHYVLNYEQHSYNRGLEVNMVTLEWMNRHKMNGWYYLVFGAGLQPDFRHAFNLNINDWRQTVHDNLIARAGGINAALTWLYLKLLEKADANGLALGTLEVPLS
jgi:hypothetical protein